MNSTLRPATLDAALEALATPSALPVCVLAGGTDHFPLRATQTRAEYVIDISGMPGLREIGRVGASWSIPCLATWSDVMAAALPAQFDGLKQAARQVGGVQIQNAGTLIGNLCNASPAADGIPCLLALDASVELASLHGTRVVPLGDFILGPRQTCRRPDELAVRLLVPDAGGVATFEKLGARAYLVISIAMVAAWARLEAGRIVAARVAVGACGPRAVVLPELAGSLIGQEPGSAIIDPALLAALTPIDDMRAPADYRRKAALELVRRAVAELGRTEALAA